MWGAHWGQAHMTLGLAEQRTAPDCLQPTLVPRGGFRQQVRASVRLPTSQLVQTTASRECAFP